MLQEQLQQITQGLTGLQTEMLLSGLFMLVIIADLLGKKYTSYLTPIIFFLGISYITWFEYRAYSVQLLMTASPSLSGMLFPDRTGLWMKIFFSVTALLTVVFERLSYKRQ